MLALAGCMSADAWLVLTHCRFTLWVTGGRLILRASSSRWQSALYGGSGVQTRFMFVKAVQCL